MKETHDPSDPLLRSIADDASELAARAAAAARQRTGERRRNRRRLVLTAAIFLSGTGVWMAMPAREVPRVSAAVPALPTDISLEPVATEAPAGVGRSLAGKRDQPEPRMLPTGLDPDEAALVKAARRQPLLLVRSRSGEVTRIHLIER